ncbi:hypothetical protein GGI15_000160 [Coemansia interrupta]|uniref:Palmitoyltransferase n=1 Tax=Coemansia interrupta TaxID=1126814 RepID=A0A9W8HQ63_9FUNG|nr:hypothetical protein GGI15_000160 [Coemansia interrupta]
MNADDSASLGLGFTPMFLRPRTASTQALRGFDIDSCDETTGYSSDDQDTAGRFSTASASSAYSVPGRSSLPSTLAASSTRSKAPVFAGHPAESAGPPVFWLRPHGFARPWDHLCMAHWAATALLIAGPGVAGGMYLRVAGGAWLVVVVCAAFLALMAVALHVATALRNVESPEARAAAQNAHNHGVVGRGRAASYVFTSGVPVVDSAGGVCRLCRCPAPPGTRHCKLCNKCVAGYDHHCRWMNTCVGEANYRSFMGYVVAAMAYLLVVLACATYCVCRAIVDPRAFRSTLDRVVGHEPSGGPWDTALMVVFFLVLALYLLVLVLPALAALGFLLAFHVRLWIRYPGMRTVDYLAARQTRRTRAAHGGCAAWILPVPMPSGRYSAIGECEEVASRGGRGVSPSRASVMSRASVASAPRGCLPPDGVSLIVGSGESVLTAPLSP